MNTKQEETSAGSGYDIHNNNHSVSRSVTGPLDHGCTSDCGESHEGGEGKAVDGEDSPRSSPQTSLQHHDISQEDTALVSSTTTNGKHGGSIDELSDNNGVENGHSDSEVELQDSDKRLDLEVSVCPANGLEQDRPEGHVIADSDSCQSVSASSQLDADTPNQEDAMMKTCSCDEATLCFCTSASFCPKRTSTHGPKQSQCGAPSKNMTPDIPQIETDDVFVKDGGLVASKELEGGIQSIVMEDTEDVKACKSFMEDLVDRIFNHSASICQEDTANFGEYCQSAIGRQWFARLIDNQRVNSKKVTEQTFYRLVQFFAVCLFECSVADDFTPGKSLMNMCFTFYHEHEGFPRSDHTTQKSFLFTHLMEQPIWKSLRFWDAAFFDAVHQERKQRGPDNQVNWRHLSSEERENTEILNENIAFGQLATFLHNMMELELPRVMCQQFLDKMATIGNLSSDQREMIQSSLGNHFHDEIEDHSRHKRLQKPFNKLVFMKRKTRHESAS